MAKRIAKNLPLLNGCECCREAHGGADVVVGDVYRATNTFLELPLVARRGYIAGIINSSTSDSFGQRAYCKTCFCAFNGIHVSLFNRVLLQVKRGVVSFASGNRGKGSTSGRVAVKDATVAYLLEYAKHTGDFMPDHEEIHLPDYSWHQVWLKLSARFKETNQVPPSQGHFNKLRKCVELRHIKIRKYKRFTKCDECQRLDKLIDKSAGVQRAYWLDQKEKHNTWQLRERAKYHKHKEQAIRSSSKHKSLCISIDGMDHSKTSAPSMARDTKEIEAAEKLETHITGVLVHGRMAATCFTWHDRFPSGSDVVATVLMDTLRRVQELDPDQPLPPTLNLWLDNCWRENKNRFFFILLRPFNLQN